MTIWWTPFAMPEWRRITPRCWTNTTASVTAPRPVRQPAADEQWPANGKEYRLSALGLGEVATYLQIGYAYLVSFKAAGCSRCRRDSLSNAKSTSFAQRIKKNGWPRHKRARGSL